jgi:hypothetical protein
MTTVALLVVLGVALAWPAAVGAVPVCKQNGVPTSCLGSMTDFFEDFETGSICGSVGGQWLCNNSARFSFSTGSAALAGSRSAVITYPSSGYPATTNQGAWADIGLFLPVVEGQKYWFSYLVRWSPGFIWGNGDPSTMTCDINGVPTTGSPPCPAPHPDTKYIEFDANTPAGACQNRFLWTAHGYEPSGYTLAQPNIWSGLPNYPGCPNRASPTVDPGMTPVFADADAYGKLDLNSGITYTMVVEVKNSRLAQGSIRVWQNGQQTMGWTNVVTCSKPLGDTDGTCNFNFMRYGGQFAGPVGTMTIDNMRLTTETCLAPVGCAGSLNTPGNPLICRGTGCTPAMLAPLGALVGALMWLRRWMKRTP